MLRLDKANVTFTSSRGGTSSLGGGKKSFTRVNLPMGISLSVFLFIVLCSVSPISGTENPDFSMSLYKSDRNDTPVNHADAKETRLGRAVLGIRVYLPTWIRECSCGRREINAMLSNICQFLLNVPNEIAGANPHRLKYSRSMGYMQYYTPYYYRSTLTKRLSRSPLIRNLIAAAA